MTAQFRLREARSTPGQMILSPFDDRARPALPDADGIAVESCS